LIIKRTAVTLSERAEPTGPIGTPASPPPETDSGINPERRKDDMTIYTTKESAAEVAAQINALPHRSGLMIEVRAYPMRGGWRLKTTFKDWK
jgi:hypothetical protein